MVAGVLCLMRMEFFRMGSYSTSVSWLLSRFRSGQFLGISEVSAVALQGDAGLEQAVAAELQGHAKLPETNQLVDG